MNTQAKTHTLAELIERLEKLSGPDRELDFVIQRAVDPIPFNDARHFTASIDCALTLAPTDSAIGLAIYLEDNPDNERGRYRATIMPPLSMKRAQDATVYAASLPLAICIAALRARAEAAS